MPEAPTGATTTARISTGSGKPGSRTEFSAYSPVLVRKPPGLPGSTVFAGSGAGGWMAGAAPAASRASSRRPPDQTSSPPGREPGRMPRSWVNRRSPSGSRKVWPSAAGRGTPNRRPPARNSTRASPIGTGRSDRHTNCGAEPPPVSRHPGGSGVPSRAVNTPASPLGWESASATPGDAPATASNAAAITPMCRARTTVPP